MRISDWSSEVCSSDLNVRARPADPIVLRQNLASAYEFATEQGGAALNDYARANDPFADLAEAQVAVDVRNVVRASADSFRIAWDERRYVRGQLSATTRWTAILTVVVRTPADTETLSRNPLGLYVHAINWSQDLRSEEHTSELQSLMRLSYAVF